ncbi:rho-related GTP-binding protein RhoN isoform X1 [Danio rerio]|uniref:Rho-related GTP-binding protein RhoN isoform X1 n=1 Tax=Danio rerio TaxID=7955 RepID=A0A8M6YXI3_DANRE|nr:rho-related GTP-binding protein RhoN isoform X1 [Danio rerio]|eukprot:XP_017210078.1 rho-related GTP-binding protein RhoN isoform X1 [Danio rerio]
MVLVKPVMLMMMDGQHSRCKVVVVGDTQCGKTALLHVFAKDNYPENYVPTVFENYTASFEIDKHRIELNMWDTSGSSYYDNVRPLAYPDCDAVLICFDISRPETLDSITKKGSLRARELGAVAYVECSSRMCVNSVRDVFHITTLVSVRREPAPSLKRSTSRRTLKRISNQPLLPVTSQATPLEATPTLREDRAKSCTIM